MADGITGLNPIRANEQIEELNINLSSVQNDFVSKTQNFLSGLSELWYSEKAVEFSNNIISSLNEADQELKKVTIDIVEDACGAFNMLADANGAMRIEVVPGPFADGEYASCKDMDPSGNIGMRIDDVNILTEEFIDELETINNKLQDIPSDIAFYDQENNLEGTYTAEVNRVKTLIEESINFIDQKITQAVNEQTESSEQASVDAADIMSS